MKTFITVLMTLYLGLLGAHLSFGHGNKAENESFDKNQPDLKQTRAAQVDEFIAEITNARVAVIEVKGMVCDFCARGLEKTFKKDNSVIKIDVKLETGTLLIAFKGGTEIDSTELKNKIIANGQEPIEINIRNI
tara:strand:- start:201 stop:602 length:402 start_codon:yes stop_codon:yes gene_type:complete